MGREKNTLNIRKHGIDFTDAYELFEQPILVLKDDRKDYKENRYIGMGYIQQRHTLEENLSLLHKAPRERV